MTFCFPSAEPGKDQHWWRYSRSSTRWVRHTPACARPAYQRTIEKLRTLAEVCESVKNWPPEDPLLLEAYAFGDVLEGADPLESVAVALVPNLPPEEVSGASSPQGTTGCGMWERTWLTPASHH
jgi:hypothetical protein